MRKLNIFLLLFLEFVIFFSKPISHLGLVSAKKDPKLIPPKHEDHPKEYYDELVERGIRLDNLTQGHPPYPFYEKMDYKAEKKRIKEINKSFKESRKLRILSEDQTLNNLGFISFVQKHNTSACYAAMRFVVNNIKKDDSRFILYPYAFDYKKKVNETQEELMTEDEGGVFSLNQSALNGQEAKFTSIQNITNAKISKAKGIYDIDIAILSMNYQLKGRDTDLFTESGLYCNYFVSTLGKISSCLDGKNAYLEYKLNNPTKGAIVRVSAKDLLNETLYDKTTSQLKFKLLIIPDYLSENEKTIFSNNYINAEAINVLNKFRELGGNILVSGKSGYLLEKIGLIPEGTYDKNFILGVNGDKTEPKIYGCQEIYKRTPDEQSDFLKQLLCMGYKNRTILTATYNLKNIPNNFENLIWYENSEKKLNYKSNGYQHDISNKSETFPYILISKEDGNKGRIFIVNGNPIKNTWYIENVRNMILYTMTRNVIYDLKIKFASTENTEEDLPIPAGEEGVQLLASYKFYNLFDKDISNFKLELLFANKIELVQIPTGCVLKNEYAAKYKEKNLTSFNYNKYLKCEVSSLNKLNSIGSEFKLEITDYTVTSKLIDIPLIYSSLSYDMNGEHVEFSPGIFYAQAALAALLRGTINKDPTSAYPMKGKGLYFDLALNVENKENTLAKDVNYIALIPLICPLVDGEDEGLIAKNIPIYEDYYFKHDFSYPWVKIEPREDDFIDYAEVAGKNICYVDDFDTPVKLEKKLRTDEDVNYPNKLIKPSEDGKLDENYGADKGITSNTILRQIYFGDSEKFYETSAPRKTLFVNTATETGASLYYGSDEIPLSERDKENEHKARSNLLFIRLDTYFYTSNFNQYQIPSGFDGSILISVDKFDQSDTTKAPINGQLFGEVMSKVYTKGVYDSSKGKYNTLKPNQYTNPLRQYKNIKQYDPTKPEDLAALQAKTNDTIKLTHFMVPNKDKYITRAGNIYGFEEYTDSFEGYFTQYPSIKFVYGHSIELILDPAKTRLGGYAEITLPSGVKFNDDEDPIEKDRITTSADNVAFYLSEYNSDTRTIKLYFRRGLMPNENYGLPSKCQLFLENLNKNADFKVTLKIYELKYDFSKDNFESYNLQETKNELDAKYKSFYSFPCLYLESKLSRKNSFSEEPSHDMYEYELMNPFARYGGYFQELTKHTTVYGTGEAHHVTNPGFQGMSHGFSLISNIGTSSIPFAEFLEHATLAVPGVPTTSRLEWSDIWGRKWAQNLRSIYPDIPPVPPTPLNFIMTTTFELISNNNKQERVIEWQSDESVFIRVQMKMRNTYKLYWEPVLCHKNQRAFIKENNVDYGNPLFIDDRETVGPELGDDYDINLGFSAVYGECYDENSYMNGTRITSDMISKMKDMMTCAASFNTTKMTECSLQATKDGLPIIKRRPKEITDEKDPTPDDNWNYSPLIEAYLPDGYIYPNVLWQLGLEDHWDDPFYKGYPFHLDDCIPNLDNPISKPHDIIAFPIYKGLGYSITYDNTYKLKKFPLYEGWWSDQLQNKDHTLIAGQQKINRVSVGHDSLLKDSDWINGYNLKQKEGQSEVITKRFKNIYVCQFNRHRVKIRANQTKYSYLKNVYQNNVIPIIPDLKEKDERYGNYDCLQETPYQYNISNISKVDNRVYTNNDRDWLYFAAGLRSNAMEDINVILKLDPMESSKYEGITKIQDGGRFTYWQPPDGPNSYQYFDSNVNTVIGKRVDVTISAKAIPTTINTFNTYLYELFDINDEKELNRECTMTTYMNSHGYGDATTTIYVGGIDGTSCKVQPGEFTYVKIVFYNNAGFDWVMKEGAITLNEASYSKFLNSIQLTLGQITAIQYPSEYKFMSYEIPEEIKEYVTLSPSQHVIDVSPQFFDLTFNNILTIKDALEGDYFYCLNVSSNFPDHLRGKLWEIKMTLNEDMFETLPSVNDPTNKAHDYHLTIPSIRFGVPIKDGVNKGKIFYNLGQAKDMIFYFRLYNEFEIKGIKIVNENIIDKLGEATQNDREKFTKLKQLWDEIPNNEEITKKIKITYALDSNTFYNLFTVNLTEAFPLFPYEEVPSKPFVNRIYLLVQSYSPHSPYGWKSLVTNSRISFNDGRKTKRFYMENSYLTINSVGPHLYPTFEHRIVEYNITSGEFYELNNQDIYNGDDLKIKLTMTVKNEGNGDAYNPKFHLKINKDAIYINKNQNTVAIQITEGGIVNDDKIINLEYTGPIDATPLKFDLYFKVKFGEIPKVETEIDQRRYLAEEKDKISLINNLEMSLCLEDVNCKVGDVAYGKQKSDAEFKITYKKNIQRNVGRISLKAENIGTDTWPKYKLEAKIEGEIDNKYKTQKVTYVFYRKIEGIDFDYLIIKSTDESSIIDEPFIDSGLKEVKSYKIMYKVIGQYSDGKTLDSTNTENEFEDSYEEKKKNGFPAYAIALIVVFGAALVAGAGFLAYKLLVKKASTEIVGNNVGGNPNTEIKRYNEGNFQEVPSGSERGKKRLQNSSVISVEGKK